MDGTTIVQKREAIKRLWDRGLSIRAKTIVDA